MKSQLEDFKEEINKKGRVISDNHIKGTFEHTTREFVVCLGKTFNLTQGGAL